MKVWVGFSRRRREKPTHTFSYPDPGHRLAE